MISCSIILLFFFQEEQAQDPTPYTPTSSRTCTKNDKEQIVVIPLIQIILRMTGRHNYNKDITRKYTMILQGTQQYSKSYILLMIVWNTKDFKMQSTQAS
jgi:hypothetical protein